MLATEPAIVHHEELDAENCRAFGKSMKCARIEAHIRRLPIVDQDRALPHRPRRAGEVLSIEGVEGPAHPAYTVMGLEDRDSFWCLKGLSPRERPGKVQGIETKHDASVAMREFLNVDGEGACIHERSAIGRAGYLSYAARQGKGKGCSSGTSGPSSFGIWTARSEVSVKKALDSVRESGSSPLRPELHLAPFPPALPHPVPAEIDHVPISLLSRHIHAEARCSLNYYVRDPLVRDGETPRDGIVLREHRVAQIRAKTGVVVSEMHYKCRHV
jgi:hypothetical protein